MQQQKTKSWEKRAVKAFFPVSSLYLSPHNTKQEPTGGRVREPKWEEEREKAGEGGSLEGRETKPVQVNNLTKHVIGLAEAERESGLS